MATDRPSGLLRIAPTEKPDPPFYEAVITAAGGQRSFRFIDGSPQNAAAAADAGLRGIIATPETLALLHANLEDIAATGFDRMAETVLAPEAILDSR